MTEVRKASPGTYNNRLCYILHWDAGVICGDDKRGLATSPSQLPERGRIIRLTSFAYRRPMSLLITKKAATATMTRRRKTTGSRDPPRVYHDTHLPEARVSRWNGNQEKESRPNAWRMFIESHRESLIFGTSTTHPKGDRLPQTDDVRVSTPVCAYGSAFPNPLPQHIAEIMVLWATRKICLRWKGSYWSARCLEGVPSWD